MKTLVVIPSLMHKYSFSAPLAWLFGKDLDKVEGVYSAALTPEKVRGFDQFIVELNWFIELFEFGLVVEFIKRHNPSAKILFGGLFSQLKYREIFARHPVDYFIKGDAELPMRQFLARVDPRQIPNLVGRDFENPQTYKFSAEEFRDLEFDTHWLAGHEEGWESFPGPDSDVDMSFEKLPRFPKYRERKRHARVPLEFRWRVPPKGGRYHLPMIITGRGGCPAAHRGCGYCMGSRAEVLRDIYGRPPVVIDNDSLIALLHKIEQKHRRVTLYVNSDCVYDFRGHHFDLEATIEIDSPSTPADVAQILPAFRKAIAHLAIFDEGLTGSSVRASLEQYMALADERHRVYFFASPEELANLGIPQKWRLYSEFLFPFWTHFDYYSDFEKALAKSKQWYLVTGQTNLYPPPKQIVVRTVRAMVLSTLWVLARTGLYDTKRLIL
ncbi:MAG TPA: hypothetical protein VEB43_21390 [Anaeromyxobacter sp.]|nr:hypothetical protein [Anaeromyxobacter sp.]